MRNLYILSLSVLLSLSLFSCNKENEIDNNSVIKTPYGLLVADRAGALYTTYDGNNYEILPYVDNISLRSLLYSGENILMIKKNVFVKGTMRFDSTNNTIDAPWQQIMYDVPSQNRLYLASNQNYGIQLSEDHGRTWKEDDQWNDNINNPSGIRISSFTQRKDNLLFAYDGSANKLYKRNGTDKWQEVNTNGFPGTNTFYLSHIGNVLIMTDYSGVGGVYHSDDDGQNWSQYSGLPATRLLCTYSPFDEKLFVGTEGAGIYKLINNNFITVNNGLPISAVIGGIAGKKNIFKNDVEAKYIYLATDKGLFLSVDQGENWKISKEGNYNVIY